MKLFFMSLGCDKNLVDSEEMLGALTEKGFQITDDEEYPVIVFIDKKGKVHIGKIRKLTPRECWRLQGFTDQQFDKVIEAGMSDTQLYKQAGNAVTVNVISAVGQIIKDVEGDK